MLELKDVTILEKVKAILTSSLDLIEEEKSDAFEEGITSAKELMQQFKENEEEESDLGEDEEEDIAAAEDLQMLLDASLGSDDWGTVQGYIEQALDVVDELIENESSEEDDDNGAEENGEEETEN